MANKKFILIFSIFAFLLISNVSAKLLYEDEFEKIEQKETIIGNETLIRNVTIRIYTFNKTNLLDPLKKGLLDYYPNPNLSSMNKEELRDFLRIYLQIPFNITKVNISGVGNFSNKYLYSIIDKANNLTKEIPKCSDDTKWGECSVIKPIYCYAGSLIEGCDLCGCPPAQECQKATGKCISKEGKTCIDGTLSDQCSSVKPKFCESGDLYDDCDSCGCNLGRECQNSSCLVSQKIKNLGDIDWEGIDDKLINTGLTDIGNFSNGVMALTTYEGDINFDLNDDCDKKDSILRLYTLSENKTYNTGMLISNISKAESGLPISNGYIVNKAYESQLGQDLNGDGDTKDIILRYFDIARDSIFNTEKETDWMDVAVSNNTIAMIGSNNKDNIQFYNIDTNTLVDTGIKTGWYNVEISNNNIAFFSYEQNLAQDLNGDKDINDWILSYYNINSRRLTNTSAEPFGYHGLAMDKNIIVFLNKKRELQIYDINKKTLTNTEISIDWSEVDVEGNLIVFRKKGTINYYDLFTGKVVDTKLAIKEYSSALISKNIIAFKQDAVLKYLNLSKYA